MLDLRATTFPGNLFCSNSADGGERGLVRRSNVVAMMDHPKDEGEPSLLCHTSENIKENLLT